MRASWPLEKKVIAAFGLALTVLVAIGAVAYLNTQTFLKERDWVMRTDEILDQLQYVLTGLTDVETGQRGYLLAGDKDFLEPYQSALQKIGQDLDKLKELMAGDTGQKSQLAALEQAVTNKLSFVRQNIALFEEKGFEEARRQIRTRAGKNEMDVIRQVTQKMRRTELDRLEGGKKQTAASARRATFTVSALIGLILALLGLVFYFIKSELAARRRIERQLQSTMQLQTAILNSANYSIISTTADGTITTFNAAAERMLGYHADELVGKTTPAIIHDHDEIAQRAQQLSQELATEIKPGFEVFVAKARPGAPDEREWTYLRKDGSRFPVLLSVTGLFDADGKIAGFLGVASDITERKKFEAALAQARDAAVESARHKSEFLANMSHEIRTPMNGVVGMVNLLLGTHLTVEQRDYADTISKSADALLKIIDDILDFSKIEAGKLAFETVDFDFHKTIEDAVELLTEPARSKRIELASLIYSDVPTRLRGDPWRLRQVITNLLSNAVKFTERGEVILRATKESETQTHVEIRITVTDTGVGIALQAQNRLFQAFTQADGSTTRKYGGTGLGLAISKELVERMGGKIGVESALDQGSAFWFTARFEKEASGAGAPRPVGVKLEGLRVLVVDDHPINRQILREQLRQFSMRPDTAANAGEALTLLRHAAGIGQDYQVAILDHCMPELDGVALANVIKSDPLIASLPLILMSSSGERPKAEILKAAHIDACLIKPVKQSTLLDCLAAVFAGAAPGKEKLPSAPEPVSPPVSPEASNVGKPRILLAEDNPVNQKVTLNQLRRLGCHADVVANGLEVLDRLQSLRYDIVLMDCQMPEMDGYETTRRIRAQSGVQPYIIALTAHAMQGDREKCLAAGMDDYLGKPLRIAELQGALERRKVEVSKRSDVSTASPRSTEAASDGSGATDTVFDASPSSTGHGETPLVDVAQLNVAGGDDPELTREVIQLYFSQAHELMPKLEAAIRGGSATDVSHLAHKLYGASATCGAIAVLPSLLELERRGAEQQLHDAELLHREIGRQLERVRDYVQQHLQIAVNR